MKLLKILKMGLIIIFSFYFLEEIIIFFVRKFSLNEIRAFIGLFPQVIIFTFLVFYLCKRMKFSFARSLNFIGFKQITAKQLFVGLGLSILILAGYFAAYLICVNRQVSVALDANRLPALFFIVVNVFFEEAVFRGFIFQLLRKEYNYFTSASVASAIWATSHLANCPFGGSLEDYLEFSTSLVGVLLTGYSASYIFEKSGYSIWSWFLVHLSIDLIAFISIGKEATTLSLPNFCRWFGIVLTLILAFPLGDYIFQKRSNQSEVVVG